MKLSSIALIFLVAVTIFGCGDKEKNQTQTSDQKNTIKVQSIKQTHPSDIKLHTVKGDEIIFTKDKDTLKLKNNNNKIVLLDFFATWCPPCKAEIPHLVNLQKKYKNRLKIISVLLEDDKPDSEIKSFIKYNHINYTVTNGANNFKLSNLLGGIQNIPFMILYDKNGKVLTHYIGIIPEEMIDSDIKKAIKK